MYVSQETPEQTRTRLLKVIKQSRLKVFAGSYSFSEFSLNRFPDSASREALALVRDGEIWSQLVPSTAEEGERFRIFSFHFKKGLDNSGFVGWLASLLKARIGTGLFVICGYNRAEGGIFDYWGCPLEVGDEVIREVKNLMADEALGSDATEL